MALRPPKDNPVFSMSVEKSDGTWLNINDGDMYKVSAESIGNAAVSWRKTEVTSPYVEGRYLVHAVKDMVTVNLTVWVTGYVSGATVLTHAAYQNQLMTNIDALVSPFEQLSYQVKYTFGNTQIVWDCQTADYSVELSKDYLYAMMVPVKFSIPRFPAVTRSAV